MLQLMRVLVGYGAGAFFATAAFLAEYAVLFDSTLIDAKMPVYALIMIGAFGWAGLPFAIMGERRGWRSLRAYLAGGVIAMAMGVATLMGLNLLQAIMLGSAAPMLRDVAGFLVNAGQLLALGVLPGLSAGFGYWLASGRFAGSAHGAAAG
jgi:hypothetical protein